MIRHTALLFFASSFSFDEHKRYYDIYKSTFPPECWPEEFERLIQHYQEIPNCIYGDSVAEVLMAEHCDSRLLARISGKPTAERMEKYHHVFAGRFPEETLALFRKALDAYAENNLGRSHYEYIAKLLGQMKTIRNGEQAVEKLLAHYRLIYSRRPAMIKILNSV